MSIDQSDVVDIISIEKQTGHVLLTVSDHLDWEDSISHQQILQRKLNTYLAFVESGEILESYPKAQGRCVVFRVVFKYAPDKAGRCFLAEVQRVIEAAGFGLRLEMLDGTFDD